LSVVTECTIVSQLLQSVPLCFSCYRMYHCVSVVTECTIVFQLLQSVPLCFSCYRVYHCVSVVTECTIVFQLLQSVPLCFSCYRVYHCVSVLVLRTENILNKKRKCYRNVMVHHLISDVFSQLLSCVNTSRLLKTVHLKHGSMRQFFY